MGAPLHVSQVLEGEYAALHGPLPPEETSWLLRADHITDPAALLARLRDPANRVSAALRSRLGGALPAQGDAAALTELLNPLLRSPQVLYDARLLQGHVDQELVTLLEQRPAGDDLVHVNRLLLDAAYRGLIVTVHQARLAAVWRRMRGAKFTALCLSGGGIRSATFALGVLQGLARAGLLGHFHYMSTVSGGGFIGSWLTAWSHRHPRGAPGVIDELAAPLTSSLTPEPRPVHRLREYSNYLSPQLGLLSADTWTLIATYLRNLLLNWLVLVPFLAAVLALPRLVVALYGFAPSARSGFGWPDLALVAGFLLSVLALAYIGYERPSHHVHGGSELKQGRGQAPFLGWCLGPLVASALLLTLYWSWRGGARLGWRDWMSFALFGAALHLASYAVYSWRLGRWHTRGLLAIAISGILGGLAAGGLADVAWPSLGLSAQLRATLAVPMVLTAMLVASTLFVGLASRATSDEDREWWSRAGAWILIAILGWSVPTTIVVWGPDWIAELKKWVASLGGVAAVVTVLLGGSSRTPASAQAEKSRSLLSLAAERAPVVAAPVLAICIAIFLSMGTDWALVGLDWARAALHGDPARARTLGFDPTRHADVIARSDAGLVLLLVVELLLMSAAMSLVVNVNKFSLHAMYRNRLIRAYLGASRVPR